MSKLVIRKRVTLEFLGDEYKDAYIDFRSVPVGDFDELTKSIEKADKENKANQEILSILKKYYLGGKFPNEKGELESLDSKEELDGLNADALIECFGKMTGQDLAGAAKAQQDLIAKGMTPEQAAEAVQVTVDPKSDTPSKNG